MMTNPTPAFKRILLKLSGEALAANQGFGVATERIHGIAAEIADVQKLGVQIAIVVGATLAVVTAASAADIPRRQPVYQQAPVGKMPIGKTPIGKSPIGKAPGPVVSRY